MATPQRFLMINPQESPDEVYRLPTFTAEDELREMSTLTPIEIAKANADLIGATTSSLSNLSVVGGASHRRARTQEEDDLNLLRIELDRVPHAEKFSYLVACAPSSPCQDEALAQNAMGRNRHLAYLEANRHDASVAARKIVAYWEERLLLFGPERAHLPMTLHGAMIDEVEWMMASSVALILPNKDRSGRTVMLGDPGRRNMTLYDTKRQNMAMWYLLETAVEDEESRSRGLVVLTSSRYNEGTGMDLKFAAFTLKAITDIFPIHLRSIHSCYPSKVAYYVIFPVLKFILGRDLRLRFKSHYGSDEDVLLQLETYGLQRSMLPKALNGDLEVDFKKWIHERLAHEYASSLASSATISSKDVGVGSDGDFSMYDASRKSTPAAVETSLTSAASNVRSVTSAATSERHASIMARGIGSPQADESFASMPALSSSGEYGSSAVAAAAAAAYIPTATNELSWRDLKFKSKRKHAASQQAASEGEFTPKGKRQPSALSDDVSASSDHSATPHPSKTTRRDGRNMPIKLNRHSKEDLTQLEEVLNETETPKGGKKKVGRRADPRMNRAVRIKLRNPDVTPFDALIQGGYHYPQPARGSSAHEIYDSENVSLHQRKNQLCRRVRQLREKQMKEESNYQEEG